MIEQQLRSLRTLLYGPQKCMCLINILAYYALLSVRFDQCAKVACFPRGKRSSFLTQSVNDEEEKALREWILAFTNFCQTLTNKM